MCRTWWHRASARAPAPRPRTSHGAFFGLAYGFTWLICLPGVLAGQGLIALPVPTVALIAVAQFGPTLAAFLLAVRAEGRAGAKRLLGRALDWRIPARWLVTTLLLPPALAGLALAVGLAGGAPRPTLPLLAQPLAILPSFLFIFFLQGPVPEEFGWRGYALDRLQGGGARSAGASRSGRSGPPGTCRSSSWAASTASCRSGPSSSRSSPT